MKQDAQDDGVTVMMNADFRMEKLSQAEREVLRAILPQLMLELIQSGDLDNDRE